LRVLINKSALWTQFHSVLPVSELCMGRECEAAGMLKLR
jgi:hypothetical protein